MSTTCDSNTVPLLATIGRQLSSRSVLTVLASESKGVQRVATEWLTRLPVEEATQILWRGFNSSERTCLSVLRALRHPELELTEVLRKRVLSILTHDQHELRRAAVAVIARRSPEDALAVLNEKPCRGDFEILRMLCWADDPKLILPLLDAFGFPQRTPPPSLGYLVTAPWLSDHHAASPDVVEWLIRECGYCEQPVTDDVVELLSLGLAFVGPTMTASGPADQWAERVRVLSWQMVPDATDVSLRDKKQLDLKEPIDQALFLAAVRETDRMRFAISRAGIPAELSRYQVEATPVCFHTPARYVRRMFLTAAESMADTLGIGASERDQFVIDHARTVLESIPEHRIVADRALRRRWFRFAEPSPNASRRNPILGGIEPSRRDQGLSPCAQSICWLAEVARLDAGQLARWLADCEQRWSNYLVPAGIEIQIPNADPNLFGSWKEALEILGIPSPNRLEFGGTLEAAFRPARSFHAILLAPELLHQRHFICSEPSQEMALHISLQGNLGSWAKTLAFPQLFIHPSKRLRNRPDAAMARVMSKGFVHRNFDIELIDNRAATEAPLVRTELRMFRLFGNIVDQRMVIAQTYVNDVVATHLIGSAMLSKCVGCQAIIDGYRGQIETAVARLPPEFMHLLNSNFYEATGDPRDEVLLRSLPIFQAWNNVRGVVRAKDLYAPLESLFEQLRAQHLQRLADHLRVDHQLDLAADLATYAQWLQRLSIVECGITLNRGEVHQSHRP